MAGEQDESSWFMQVLLLLGCCVLALVCYLIWEVTRVVVRVEEGVAAVSEDVKTVAKTAARVSVEVGEMMDRMEELRAKLRDSVPTQELEDVLDEMKKARENPANLEPATKAEVDTEVTHLLATIRRSDCRYVRNGKEVSALNFYGYLLGKYKLYEGTVTSAEDFIEKVATKTMTGEPYYAVIEGKKVALAVHLREALAKYREKE